MTNPKEIFNHLKHMYGLDFYGAADLTIDTVYNCLDFNLSCLNDIDDIHVFNDNLHQWCNDNQYDLEIDHDKCYDIYIYSFNNKSFTLTIG